jgi:hypothetical protein
LEVRREAFVTIIRQSIRRGTIGRNNSHAKRKAPAKIVAALYKAAIELSEGYDSTVSGPGVVDSFRNWHL